MNKTTRRKKTLLTAVALGVCCAYAQTATPGGLVLPNVPPDAGPYDFRMSKTDDGMSVSLTLNRIDRTVTDSVAETCRVSVPGLSSTTFAGLPALPYKAFRIAPEGSGTPQIIIRDSTYIDIPVNLDHNPRIEYDSIGQPRQIFCGSTPIQISKGKIKSVVFDRTTQKATVTYTLNASGHVSFAVTDLNNNAIQATIEITEQENKQIIHLTNAPTGICVVSMMVDGEVVDIYKLLKQ